MMKRCCWILFLMLICLTTVNAEEHEFFQSVILSREEICPAEQIILNDELTVSIPEHWDEILYEEDFVRCFEYQDDLARSTVYFGWLQEPEMTFEMLLEDLDEISDVICNANKSGFEWTAGNTSDGIVVVVKGEKDRIYLILFNSAIWDEQAYERVVREYGFILHSLRRLEPAVTNPVQENVERINENACHRGSIF